MFACRLAEIVKSSNCEIVKSQAIVKSQGIVKSSNHKRLSDDKGLSNCEIKKSIVFAFLFLPVGEKMVIFAHNQDEPTGLWALSTEF